MTREQAYDKLELTEGADLQLVRKQFSKLHNDFQVRIDNAPTPTLKRAFERGLEELKEAYALLNESDSVDDTRSLPHNERSFGDESLETEPHIQKTAQGLSLDKALIVFGLSATQSSEQIEAAMGKRISQLKDQLQGIDVPDAKKAIQKELSKAEEAQRFLQNWLTEKKQATQAKQQQTSPASDTPAPQKKSKVWLLLLPLLLIAGGVVYYLSQQTQTATPEQPQMDITAVRDSAAWHSALAGNSEKNYQYYLKEYPNGIFGQAARDSLAKIAVANAATKTAADQPSKEQEQARLAAAERKGQQDTKKAALPIPEMVYVEGGSFQMGGSGQYDGKPIHAVRLSSYSIGKYEVTFEEYDAFCKATGRSLPYDYGDSRGRNPVVGVSWYDAVAYCNWLSETTGQTYRLPTEAEWEFAARGGNKSRGTQYSGSNSIGSVAWYKDNYANKKHSVGQKSANELGIYDMSGNVWEWCSDWMGFDYYAKSPASNPKGPSQGDVGARVIRGGSWNSIDVYCRVAYRIHAGPDDGHYDRGFRVARSE